MHPYVLFSVFLWEWVTKLFFQSWHRFIHPKISTWSFSLVNCLVIKKQTMTSQTVFYLWVFKFSPSDVQLGSQDTLKWTCYQRKTENEMSVCSGLQWSSDSSWTLCFKLNLFVVLPSAFIPLLPSSVLFWKDLLLVLRSNKADYVSGQIQFCTPAEHMHFQQDVSLRGFVSGNFKQSFAVFMMVSECMLLMTVFGEDLIWSEVCSVNKERSGDVVFVWRWCSLTFEDFYSKVLFLCPWHFSTTCKCSIIRQWL